MQTLALPVCAQNRAPELPLENAPAPLRGKNSQPSQGHLTLILIAGPCYNAFDSIAGKLLIF